MTYEIHIKHNSMHHKNAKKKSVAWLMPNRLGNGMLQAFFLVEMLITECLSRWAKACSIARLKESTASKGNVLVKKSASRCGIVEAMSFNNKHYDGDEALAVGEFMSPTDKVIPLGIGCEPCMLKAKLRMHRRNTHRSFKYRFITVKASLSKTFPKALKHLPAFSLVEMLMALLVASLLMAALAPVMTKKYTDNVSISANNTTQSKGWRLYTYSPDCDKAEGKDNVCEFKDFSIPKGVYALNLIMVSGGGGGAGSTVSVIKNANPYEMQNSTTTSVSPDEPLEITKNMTNVQIDFMTGGGGGGGGGAAIFKGVTPSKENCKNYGTGKTDTVGNTGVNFAVYDDANKLCVTKFNQAVGSSGAQGCYNGYSNACSSNTSTGTYVYSGCGRWTCTHDAAEVACSTLAANTGDSWRLPIANELVKWNNSTYWKTFMLCDLVKETVVSKCGTSSSYMIGTADGIRPHRVWSSTKDTNGNYIDYHLDSNTSYIWGKVTAAVSGYAFSVRCVLPTTKVFYSIAGSGGGASPSINSTNSINSEFNSIVKNNVGGTIEITAGGGGNAGSAANAKAQKAANGGNGKESCVRVKNTANTVVFKVCVLGGKAGIAADGTTGNGTGGSAQSAIAVNEGCYKQYSENGAKTYFNCTNAGKAGTSGTSDADISKTGGYGGISSFIGADTTGAGYNLSTAAGITLPDGSNPGAGGGAGRSVATTSNTEGYIIGSGAQGSGGLVKLTYQNEFSGSGGGGGAGGTMVKITNLSLPSDTECSIKVGGGGNYGSGQNGKDGGDTSIKCGNNNPKEYIVYGGEGGKLGTSGIDINTPNPTGGKGGNIKKVNDNIIQLGTLAEIIYGEGNNNNVTDETALKINGNLNIGGNGGNSATGAIGGCGGLRPDDDPDCTNTNQNATLPEYVAPIYTSLIQDTPDYGKAGAGGAGGGWSKTQTPKQGIGSSGQPGYLFLWWDQI